MTQFPAARPGFHFVGTRDSEDQRRRTHLRSRTRVRGASEFCNISERSSRASCRACAFSLLKTLRLSSVDGREPLRGLTPSLADNSAFVAISPYLSIICIRFEGKLIAVVFLHSPGLHVSFRAVVDHASPRLLTMSKPRRAKDYPLLMVQAYWQFTRTGK